jgi:hypothetical protein
VGLVRRGRSGRVIVCGNMMLLLDALEITRYQ